MCLVLSCLFWFIHCIWSCVSLVCMCCWKNELIFSTSLWSIWMVLSGRAFGPVGHSKMEVKSVLWARCSPGSSLKSAVLRKVWFGCAIFFSFKLWGGDWRDVNTNNHEDHNSRYTSVEILRVYMWTGATQRKAGQVLADKRFAMFWATLRVVDTAWNQKEKATNKAVVILFSGAFSGLHCETAEFIRHTPPLCSCYLLKWDYSGFKLYVIQPMFHQIVKCRIEHAEQALSFSNVASM